MTVEELRALVPEGLAPMLARMTPDLRDSVRYLAAANEAVNAGTLEDEIPTVEEWRSCRGD